MQEPRGCFLVLNIKTLKSRQAPGGGRGKGKGWFKSFLGPKKMYLQRLYTPVSSLSASSESTFTVTRQERLSHEVKQGTSLLSPRRPCYRDKRVPIKPCRFLFFLLFLFKLPS